MIDIFKSIVDRDGLARNNRFRALIFAPVPGSTVDSLFLYCNASGIPARDVETFEGQQYGNPRHFGGNQTYSDLTLNFYLNEALTQRQFFDTWMDLIYNPRTKEYGYYDNYEGTIEISKFDTSWNREVARYKFLECQPTNIGDLSFSYDNGDVAKMDVAFKYRNYERVL